jgi:hypothetical protein
MALRAKAANAAATGDRVRNFLMEERLGHKRVTLIGEVQTH